VISRAQLRTKPRPTNRRPRWYGYARASKTEQVNSTPRQTEDIRRYVATLEEAQKGEIEEGRIAAENESATSVRWYERAALAALIDEIQSGDHLIVWRLDRLDRSPFEMVALVKKLCEEDVTVHTLSDFGGQQVRLDTLIGRMMVWCMAMASDFFITQHSEAIKAGLRFRRENGFAYSQPPVGSRTEPIAVEHQAPNGTKQLKTYIPDEHEWACIREIIYRIDVCHETYQEIARDWRKRGVKTAKHRWWAYKRHARGRGREFAAHRMAEGRRLAYAFGHAGGVPISAILALPRQEWTNWDAFQNVAVEYQDATIMDSLYEAYRMLGRLREVPIEKGGTKGRASTPNWKSMHLQRLAAELASRASSAVSSSSPSVSSSVAAPASPPPSSPEAP